MATGPKEPVWLRLVVLLVCAFAFLGAEEKPQAPDGEDGEKAEPPRIDEVLRRIQERKFAPKDQEQPQKPPAFKLEKGLAKAEVQEGLGEPDSKLGGGGDGTAEKPAIELWLYDEGLRLRFEGARLASWELKEEKKPAKAAEGEPGEVFAVVEPMEPIKDDKETKKKTLSLSELAVPRALNSMTREKRDQFEESIKGALVTAPMVIEMVEESYERKYCVRGLLGEISAKAGHWHVYFYTDSDRVKALKRGQKITVKGECTSVNLSSSSNIIEKTPSGCASIYLNDPARR